MAIHHGQYSRLEYEAKHIVTEIVRKEYNIRIPESELVMSNFSVDAAMVEILRAFSVSVVERLASTRDSNRFETKTEKTSETTEADLEMLPTTLKDHFKQMLLNFIQHKLRWKGKVRWLHINYITTKHVVTTVNHVINHNTILEYTCPHMRLPSDHRNHVLHLAQGVPLLRDWSMDQLTNPRNRQ